MVNGLVTVSVNGITNSLNVFQTDPAWETNTVYFKAGDYCQDNGGTTNEGARVSIYSLTAGHAPAIINQPTNQIVTAGQNATFTVGANGNGTLGYHWQFNATNAFPFRRDASWMRRAANSLPVPLSPRMRTGESEGA